MGLPQHADQSLSGRERRNWSRTPADAFPNVKTTLKSGLEVELIDMSRSGAQFRTPNRLLPGLSVTLCLVTPDGKLNVEGKVMRSTMVKLKNGSLGYEVGVSFDLLLMGVAPKPDESPAAAAPELETPEAPATTAAADSPPARQPSSIRDIRELAGVSASAGRPSDSVDSLMQQLGLK
jgi:hypothetical protein